MKIPDNFKPQFVISKDTSRYVLMNAYVKHGLIAATNGRSLVAAVVDPTDENEVEEGFVSKDVLVAATKKRTKGHPFAGLVTMLADGVCKVFPSLSTTIIDKNACSGKFPNIEKVFTEHVKPVSIAFNAKLLMDMANALGDNEVQLTYDADFPASCFYIKTRSNDRIGIIMPLRFHRGVQEPANLVLDKINQLNADAV